MAQELVLVSVYDPDGDKSGVVTVTKSLAKIVCGDCVPMPKEAPPITVPRDSGIKEITDMAASLGLKSFGVRMLEN